MAQKPKLTLQQKEEIKNKHNDGRTAYSLAKEYGVSDTTIFYTVYPERLENNRKNTVKNNAKNVLRVQKCLRKKKEQKCVL